MACETFLKICHKCKRKFVVIQPGEAETFVNELLGGLTETIRDLEAHQARGVGWPGGGGRGGGGGGGRRVRGRAAEPPPVHHLLNP